ncbi:MAG: alpha,2-mannosyltransferase, partial [Pseudonocardiales bacterium]|nr:alpha,2-mannosyltransferase [Pseudonocardiales bacterium]
MVVAVAVLLVGSGFLLRAAWTRPAGRVLVVLVAAQLVVLAVSPSWFPFYADYLTPGLALALAVGVDGVRGARRAPLPGIRHVLNSPRTGLVAVIAALTVLVVPLCWQRAGSAFPGARLTKAVRAARCVTADSPMALIELNALSRSFAPGCRDWVDVVGRTYGADRAGTARRDNLAWQRDVTSYLLSGDAFIVIRPSTGLSAQTRAELERRRVIARAGRFVIYRGALAGG